MRILLVEDDDAIADSLRDGLLAEGFTVDRARTGAQACAAAPADLVLLDLGLPDGDGAEVCRELRRSSTVPIIVVTARGEEADRVAGLDLGADDYVVKPFGYRELLARIRAVTRRSAAGPEPAQVVGALTIDRRARRVALDGEELALTPTEYLIVVTLANDPGALVTRRELLDAVWGPHWYGTTKMIDVHVAALRKKLGDPGWIETARGVGFRFATVR